MKLLLKRGALLAAANWPVVLIQFAAQTTFQVLLAVPIIGAAVLVAVLLGGDLGNLLQGSMRDIFTTIAEALDRPSRSRSVAFVVAFADRAGRRLGADVPGEGRHGRRACSPRKIGSARSSSSR